jgi:hypothetical protein
MATKRDIAQQSGRMSALATEIENSDDHQKRLARLETRRRS